MKNLLTARPKMTLVIVPISSKQPSLLPFLSTMKRAPASNRRATLLSVQRLLTLPQRTTSRAPPGVPGDLLMASTPLYASATPLPPWSGLVAMSSNAFPTCACCGDGMTWADWMSSAAWLPLGEGLFSASCELCRQRDALFKDGRAH